MWLGLDASTPPSFSNRFVLESLIFFALSFSCTHHYVLNKSCLWKQLLYTHDHGGISISTTPYSSETSFFVPLFMAFEYISIHQTASKQVRWRYEVNRNWLRVEAFLASCCYCVLRVKSFLVASVLLAQRKLVCSNIFVGIESERNEYQWEIGSSMHSF